MRRPHLVCSLLFLLPSAYAWPAGKEIPEEKPIGDIGGIVSLRLLAPNLINSPIVAELAQNPDPDVSDDPVEAVEPDPVNLATGEFFFSEQDLFQPGIGMPLEFTRHYASGKKYNGPLGWCWDSPWFMRLQETAQGIIYFDGKLRQDLFKLEGGSYKTPAGLYFSMSKTGAGNSAVISMTAAQGESLTFEFSKQSGVNAWYRIRERQNANGNRIQFLYASSGMLAKVVDTLGRETTIDTLSTGVNAGRIWRIKDPSGAAVQYSYNIKGELIGITAPPVPDFPEGSKAILRYDALGKHRLLSIQDPGQTKPYLANQYDGAGRVTSQQYGESNQITLIDYSNFPKIRVTDPESNVVDYWVDPQTHQITQKKVYDAFVSGKSYLTTYQYNGDFLPTQAVLPTGQVLNWIYDTSNPDPKKRHNLLSFKNRASLADPGLVSSYTYHPVWNKVQSIMTPQANILSGGILAPNLATQAFYDSKGNLERVLRPLIVQNGVPQLAQTLLSYDLLGRVLSVINPRGVETRFVYDSMTLQPYAKQRIQDPVSPSNPSGLNFTTDYEYDASNNVKRVSSCGCGGEETFYEYNARNEMFRVRRPLGDGRERLVEVHYTAAGDAQLVRVLDDSPFGDGFFETSYAYSLARRVRTVKRDLEAGKSVETKYGYDKKNRLNRVDLPEGVSVDFAYNERSLPVRATLLGIPSIPADDVTLQLGYDGNGRLNLMVDTANHVYSFLRDGYGRLQTLTNPALTSTQFGWDADDQLRNVQVFDASGILQRAVEKEWDLWGRNFETRVLARDIFGQNLGGGAGWLRERRLFDLNGNLTQLLFDNGTTLNTGYDALDRVIWKRDSLAPSNGADFHYAANGRLRDVWLLEGNQASGASSSRLLYEITQTNAVGNPLRVKDAIGKDSAAEWTLNGQLAALVDRNGHRQEFLYDELGRLMQKRRVMSSPQNDQVADFAYDGNSNLVSMLARNAPFGPDELTQFSFNPFNAIESVRYADGSVRSFHYDAAMRLETVVDPNGTVRSLGYDELNRISDVNIVPAGGIQGSVAMHFQRDIFGEIAYAENENSRVLRLMNTLGQVELESQESKITPGFNAVFQMRHDAFGRLGEIVYPTLTAGQNDRAIFTRDGLGRLEEVQKMEGGAIRSIAKYLYEGDRVVRETRPSLTTKLSYDALGRMKSVHHEKSSGTPIAYLDVVEYDGEWNIRKLMRSFFDGTGNLLPPNLLGGGVQYEYDEADQLVASRSGLSPAELLGGNGAGPLQLGYLFDRVRNRSTQTTDVAGVVNAVPYAVNALNNYTAIAGSPVQSDANGNPTSMATGSQIGYDGLDRPVSIAQSGKTTQIFYDPFGRRLETHDSNAGASFLGYVGWNVLHQKDAAQSFDYAYGDGIDEVLERRGGGQAQQFLSDLSGSPIVLTSAAGQQLETYRYTDYGQRLGASPANGQLLLGSPSALGNPVAFQGRWELGGGAAELDFRNRVYRPSEGRFLTPDPLGFPDSPNRYHFVGNNPVNERDPSGLFPLGEHQKQMAAALQANGINPNPQPNDHSDEAEFARTAMIMVGAADTSELYSVSPEYLGGNNPIGIAKGLANMNAGLGLLYHALGSDADVNARLSDLKNAAADSCASDPGLFGGWTGLLGHYVGDFHAHVDGNGERFTTIFGHGLYSIGNSVGGAVSGGVGSVGGGLHAAGGFLGGIPLVGGALGGAVDLVGDGFDAVAGGVASVTPGDPDDMSSPLVQAHAKAAQADLNDVVANLLKKCGKKTGGKAKYGFGRRKYKPTTTPAGGTGGPSTGPGGGGGQQGGAPQTGRPGFLTGRGTIHVGGSTGAPSGSVGTVIDAPKSSSLRNSEKTADK